jgi:hypothetical protein
MVVREATARQQEGSSQHMMCDLVVNLRNLLREFLKKKMALLADEPKVIVPPTVSDV